MLAMYAWTPASPSDLGSDAGLRALPPRAALGFLADFRMAPLTLLDSRPDRILPQAAL
jgi:hypothetical protein